MRFKKLIIFIVFILLFFNIFIQSGLAQADYFFIADITGYPYDHTAPYTYHLSSNNMVVDSNGDYHIIFWNDSSPYNFTRFYSTDDGDTWNEDFLFDMSLEGDYQPDMISTYIDDNDIIHIAYSDGDGSGCDIWYRNYNIGTDTISSPTQISEIGTLDNNRLFGLVILKNDDGEIAIANSRTHSSYNNATIRIKVYNDQADAWGDEDIIDYEVTAGDTFLQGLNGDVLSNGTFVFSYYEYLSSPVSRFKLSAYDDYTQSGHLYFQKGCASNTNANDFTDIAIDSNDVIHVVYESSPNQINYTRYWYGNDTYQGELITDVSNNDPRTPQISINSDGTIQLVFEFDDAVAPSDWIGGVYGSYGSWSDLQYYQSGVTDNYGYPKIVYQNLQSFTHLTDGVVGYYVNMTDDTIIHFDEGYELFYSDTPVSEDEWDTCTGTSYTIEKQFNNSVCYWNQTVEFKVTKSNVFYSQVQILNASGTIVKEYPITTIPIRLLSFTPFMWYGSGTFTIRARNYGDSTWDISDCEFTVLSDADIGGWNFFSNDFDSMTGCELYIKNPSGTTAQVSLEIYDVNGAVSTANHTILTDISGDGSYNTYPVDIDRLEGYKYKFYLWNTTDMSYPKHIHTYTIPLTIFDYTLLLNDEKSTTLYYGEKNQFTGEVTHTDLNYGISIYNGVYSSSKTPEKTLPVSIYNDHYFTTTYYVSDSLTNGTYYCYLTIDGSPILDGGHCVFTYTIDVTPPEPIEDTTWYGLPYWVPYLIGVFLTLFITISPLVIAGYVTRKTQIEKVNIPDLVYVGFFFFGLIISVSIGFLPVWLPFVILFGMIVYFAVQWLYGKKGAVEGE